MAVYIGADGQPHQRDEELRHYKYIKREKLPNGKWRYYYDVEEILKDAKAMVGSGEDKEGRALQKAVRDVKTAKALGMSSKTISEKEAIRSEALKQFFDKRLKDTQKHVSTGEEQFRKMLESKESKGNKETKDWVDEQLKEAQKRNRRKKFGR